MLKKVSVNVSGALVNLQNPNWYSGAVKSGAVAVESYIRTEYYAEKNDREPNRLGGRRTNFWSDVGRSVSKPVIRNLSAIIRIKDPRIAQKVFGGPIRPKRSKFLTIPISQESHGLRVSVFERKTGKKLFRIKSKKGNFLLVESVDGGIIPHYSLKQEVDQKPWPGALPKDQEMQERFEAGAIEYIEAQAKLV